MNKLRNVQMTAISIMKAFWTVMAFVLLKRGIPALFLNRDFGYALGICSLACIIGFNKYHFVLKKTINRFYQRIDLIESAKTVYKAFDRKFIILIIAMMGLGWILRIIPGFEIAKGFLRVAVGFALLFGAFKMHRQYHLWYARLK